MKVIIINDNFNLQVIRYIDQNRSVYRSCSSRSGDSIGRAGFKDL